MGAYVNVQLSQTARQVTCMVRTFATLPCVSREDTLCYSNKVLVLSLAHAALATGKGRYKMSKKLENNSVRHITIDESSAGQRIDNYLLGRLKGVPRSLVYRILRRGEVRVNGGRIKPMYKLRLGDSIRIPPVTVLEKGTPKASTWSEFVIHDSKTYLVINKPAKIAVHGGSGVNYGLIEQLRACTDIPHAKHFELVHRLDKDTSGCILIAKKRSSLRALHALFRAGEITKSYYALVRGTGIVGKKVVNAPLKRVTNATKDRYVTVAEDGLAAKTVLTPVECYNESQLILARPITGRTHQIRVHTAHIGQPIIGDEKYGGKLETNRYNCSRLFLHASSLQFPCPDSGSIITIEATMPQELTDILDGLRK